MSRESSSRRRLLVLGAAALSVFLACSGGSGGLGGGCGGLLDPIPNPGGWYQGPKTDDPVVVRLSPSGVDYLNANFSAIVQSLVPGGVIHFPLGCMIQSGYVIADQGDSSGNGRLDGQCDYRDVPADIPIQITGLQLQPGIDNNGQPLPDGLTATVDVSINTPKIYARSQGNSSFCVGASDIEFSFQFQSSQENPPYNELAATIQFTVDTRWDKLLSFNVLNLDGTEVCGSNQPRCIDPNAVSVNGENFCGSVYAFFADLIKGTILPAISPVLQQFIVGFVNQESCASCSVTSDCMQQPPTDPTATSTCSGGLIGNTCTDDQQSGQCVPRFLGMQGRMTPAKLLGTFGVPPTAQMDLSVALGGSGLTTDATPNVNGTYGLDIGTRAGVNAVGMADCVPPAQPPALPQLQFPDFDGEAPALPDGGVADYHVGLGVSQPFLDLLMYNAQQSGTLCLEVSSANFGIINTGIFKTFLPSLGKLATRDGNDAPMMIVLRPQTPPTATVGAGTVQNGQLVSPLITLNMPNMVIDFYAMFDDRYARLFSLEADISLPLALVFEGCDSVTPVLGNLQQVITNIRVTNSEILAEDPTVLKDLIPAVLGFAQPALANILKPFKLPQLGTLKLKVDGAKGVENIVGTNNYNFLGLFAELLPANAQCAVGAPTTIAKLDRSIIPPASQMRLQGKPLPLPAAVLGVQALHMNGTPEFTYRVDQGFWHEFQKATNGELTIADAMFLIQGRHTIEVRSRMAESPHGISAPVSVGFTVDWDPPEVQLSIDRSQNRIEVTAHDTVSADSALVYAYQVGPSGSWSDYGPARPIDLGAVEDAGGLAVRVRDEAGNVGEATYRPAITATRPDAPSAAPDSPARGGCSTADDGLALIGLFGCAGWLWRRRRARY